MALTNARTTANFTAIFVTNQCVNNAEMNIHQRTPETKSHEVVPYLPGKRKPPVEKCKEHSSNDIDMIWENCHVPLCSKCAILNHRGHISKNIDAIYPKTFTLSLWNLIHPSIFSSNHTKKKWKKDREEELSKLNQLMDKLNTPAEANSIKTSGGWSGVSQIRTS